MTCFSLYGLGVPIVMDEMEPIKDSCATAYLRVKHMAEAEKEAEVS